MKAHRTSGLEPEASKRTTSGRRAEREPKTTRPPCGFFGRSGRFGRATLALASVGAAVALAFAGGAPQRAEAGTADPAPDGAVFPAWPGAKTVALGGEVRVDGHPVSTSTFRTRATPAEVIAFHRRHFEARPVDLAENALPDGRALFVLDVLEGRRCIVTARGSGGVTEVIRSWSPLAFDDSAEVDLPVGMPDDLVGITRVDDGPAVTWTARSPRGTGVLVDELRGRFVGAGWAADEVADDEADGLPSRTIRFSEDGKEATLSVAGVPDGGSLVVLRILPGEA